MQCRVPSTLLPFWDFHLYDETFEFISIVDKRHTPFCLSPFTNTSNPSELLVTVMSSRISEFNLLFVFLITEHYCVAQAGLKFIM